jgi:sugar-specific transcriptional regulator TrmB
MNSEHQKLLEQIGLTNSEARLYIESLKLGPSSAIHLGQKLNLTRQMVYTLLPALIEKGLIKQVEISGKRLFQAMGPEVLKDRTAKISKEIESIIPLLKTRQAENNAIPLITVYENPIAMREWYRLFMKQAKKGDELLVWSTGKVSYWYELDPDFYKKYLDISSDKGVKTFVILPDDEEASKHQKEIARKNTQYKLCSHRWNDYGEKWVWRDQVCYLSIHENATNMIVIESKTLADIERFDFWTIWSSLK